jgi:membrane protease YdiL (CAAX protease family)
MIPTVLLLTLNGFYLGDAQRASVSLFWILDLTQYVFVPLLSFWALWRFAGVRPDAYGLARLAGDKTSFSGLILWAVVLFVFTVGDGAARFLATFVPIVWGGSGFSYSNAIPTNPEGALAALAYICFSAAMVEEIVYRGLPLVYLSSRSAPSALNFLYPVISATAFSIIHWENGSYELVATFVLGLVLAALYARVKNLWPFIFGHTVADILAFTGYYSSRFP